MRGADNGDETARSTDDGRARKLRLRLARGHITRHSAHATTIPNSEEKRATGIA